jgi:hypothetical protein
MELRIALTLTLMTMTASVLGADGWGGFVRELLKPRPKITISKETTYIEGPLGPDGYIDYAAALNERCRKGVTVENNAAIPFWQAIGPKEIDPKVRPRFFKLLGIPPLPEKGSYLVGFLQYVGQLKDSPAYGAQGYNDWWQRIEKQQDKALARPWSREELPVVAGWLSANEKPLAAIVEATRRPKFYSPLVKTDGMLGLGLGVMNGRHAVQLLCVRAMLLAKAGRIDDAWQDLLAARRLGRLIAQGPYWVDHVVAASFEMIACDGTIALAHHARPTLGQVLRFETDLRHLPAVASTAERCLWGERLWELDFLTALARAEPGAINLLPLLCNEPRRKALVTLAADPRVDWDAVLRQANETLDKAVAAYVKHRYSERKQILDKLAAETDAMGKRAAARAKSGATLAPAASRREATEYMIDLLFGERGLAGGYATIATFEPRAAARFQLAEIALALAGYRSVHGRYPAASKELCPECIGELPFDPFTEQDFHYRTKGAGYILYSVGANGKDDSGENALLDPAKQEKYKDETDHSKIPDDITIRTPDDG